MKKLYQKILTLGLMSLLFFSSSNVMGQVFITEIADPNNDAGLRFIELYNAGATAVDFTEGSGWRIDKYTNANATVSQTLALTGTIPAGGYYIVAAGAIDGDFFTAYGVEPDLFDGADNNVAGSNGDDNLELYDGAGTLIDQFGVPGEDGTGTNHEFEDGRAKRKSTVTAGNPIWDVTEWDIDNDGTLFPGAGPIDAPAGFSPSIFEGETNAPVFLDATPAASNVLEASFDLNVYLNERGTAYYVVLADAATAPNAAEVKAGTGNAGSAAVAAGSIVVASNGALAENIAGLTAETAYDIYVIAEDLALNQSGVQTVLEITTTANVAPTISSVATSIGEISSDLIITMSEDVTVTDASGFSVIIGGSAANVSSIAGSGTSELTLTIVEEIAKNSGDVFVTYDDASGNVTDGTFPLASVADLIVTNNTTLNIVANLEAARVLTPGELVQVTGELEVSFIRNSGSTMYTQDGTRGIIIQDDNNILTIAYAVGDVIANVKGTINQDFTDVLEIIPTVDPGVAVGTGVVITPQLVSIVELNINFTNYESRVITIEGIGFANAGAAFDAGGDDYNIGSAGDTTIFRDNFSDVRYEADVFIPYGTKDVIGLAGQFQGTAQIVPFSTSEAIVDNYSPVIDGDATPADTTTSSFNVTVSFDEPAKVQYLVNTSATATQADVLASATMVQVNNPADSAMIAVTGLDDNTQYYVHIVATDTTGANPQAAVTTVGAKTIEIIFDKTSNITAATTPITAATISSVAATSELEAIAVFNFMVVDSATTDNVPTEISSLTIKNANATLWSAVLAGAKITNGEDTVAVTTITDTELAFDFSTPFIVENGGDTTFTVLAWLNTTQIDGTELAFEIPADHSFVADATGSSIVISLDAAITSATHTIDVVATELTIADAPTSVITGEAFGFSVTAQDANGNVDTAARQLTASTAASGVLGGTLAGPMTAGVYTYADLTYDTEGIFTVAVSDGSLNATTTEITAISAITGSIFFSEYFEGSSNNKYVEIYNGTNADIDLSTVEVKQGNNGAGFDGHAEFPAAYSITLSGTLAAGDVYVIYNGQASIPEIIAEGDLALSYGDNPGDRVAAFNGDDAMGLFLNGVLVDLIGDPAVDPGSSWDVAGVAGATTNHTLVRKSSITEGNITALGSFGTTAEDSEWEVYDQDVVTYLGFFGEITDPIIVASTTDFNGDFGYVVNGNSSAVTTYMLSAVNLTTDLEVTAPAGFELSVNADFSAATDTLIFVPATGSVSDTTIYVRFTPTAADGASYAGDILHIATGADTVKLAVSGIEGALAISTIADVRANNSLGELVKVTGTVIGGVNHSSASRAIFDGTAGITVRGFDFPTADLVVGDSIVIEGTLSEFAGLLQMEPTAAITIAAQGVALPTPQVKTIAEIGESVESELVLVQNVRFVETGVFAGGGGAGNFRVANDAGDTLAFRLGSSSHPLVDTEIPTAYVNITAWVGQFNDAYQLSPETVEDIEIIVPEPSMTVNGSALAFGSIESGTVSTAQSFTVAGLNLSVDILVTAPAAYEVSLEENGTYGESVVAFVDQAGEVAETTIFVRFAPTVTGTINGELSISTGELSEVLAVSGTATEAIPTANKKALTGVKAYPNPSTGLVQVELSNNNTFTYQLIRMDGSIIQRGTARQSTTINIAGVNTGLYLLEVVQNDKVFRTRIVKK